MRLRIGPMLRRQYATGTMTGLERFQPTENRETTVTIIPEPNSCLRSLSTEMQSKANRIRHLIGDAHFLLDAHLKEDI